MLGEDIDVERGDHRVAQACSADSRKPGLLPGRGSYQVPHSSTASSDVLFGIVLVHDRAEWRVMSSSISSVWSSVEAHSLSGKPSAGPLSCPVASRGAGVEVQRQPVDQLAGTFHHRLGPFVIGPRAPLAILSISPVPGVGEGDESGGQVGGIFRGHVAAAAPQSRCRCRDSPPFQASRGRLPHARAPVRSCSAGAVMYSTQCERFGGRAAADIGRDIGVVRRAAGRSP